MSWRRFSTLLRGLGPDSASASRATVRRLKLDKDRQVHTVTGSKEHVIGVFSSMFGGLARQKGKHPGPPAGPGPEQG